MRLPTLIILGHREILINKYRFRFFAAVIVTNISIKPPQSDKNVLSVLVSHSSSTVLKSIHAFTETILQAHTASKFSPLSCSHTANSAIILQAHTASTLQSCCKHTAIMPQPITWHVMSQVRCSHTAQGLLTLHSLCCSVWCTHCTHFCPESALNVQQSSQTLHLKHTADSELV